jgi:uncharacterized protein
MSPLGNPQKQLLLDVARRAVTAAVERCEIPGALPEALDLGPFGGAFVTLHQRGRLRGCIGQIIPIGSLVEIVAYAARAAALEDPRFPPVRSEELAHVDIEISVLSILEEVALERIETGKHGLMVSRGAQRGLLLPQVATQYGWTAERFLAETCIKAGFERHAWKDPASRIYAFTAEVFSELEFRTAEDAGVAPPGGRGERGYSSST